MPIIKTQIDTTPEQLDAIKWARRKWEKNNSVLVSGTNEQFLQANTDSYVAGLVDARAFLRAQRTAAVLSASDAATQAKAVTAIGLAPTYPDGSE